MANSPIAVFVFILKYKMIMMVSFALEIPVPQPMRTPYVSTITLKEGAKSDAKTPVVTRVVEMKPIVLALTNCVKGPTKSVTRCHDIRKQATKDVWLNWCHIKIFKF